MTEEDLLRLHRGTMGNAEQLARSSVCGCFYCLEVFGFDQVTAWVDDEGLQTALCPFCEVDAVIGDACGEALTPSLLRQMHQRWFSRASGL